MVRHVDSGPAAPDEILIVRANVLRFKELDSFLGRHMGGPESGQNPDALYPGLGYAARSAADVIGIVLFYLIPSIVPGEDLCFLFGAVDPLYRRRGVGTRLMNEVLAAARLAVNRLALIASLPDRNAESAAAFLGRFGFAEMDCEVHYRHDLIGIELVGENPRFEIREYRGGDPSLDRAIVDLHRRAYRGHPCIADLTDELLALRLANPSCYYDLLFHESQLIGYASFWINKGDCRVDSLLVARRYWGCGASDALVHSVECLAVERGCASVSTISRRSNRAVISLMHRHSCYEVKTTRRFCRRFSSDVSGFGRS
jgi:GNAT superfamily N-acetyltransferase